MKNLFLLFLSITLIGCAAKGPNLSKLNTLRPGISKVELAAYFNGMEPRSTDLVNNYYLLKYYLYDSNDIGNRLYYFVFDQHDHLLGWEEYRGQNTILVKGFNLTIPFPSR